jgi:hypothetical protein
MKMSFQYVDAVKTAIVFINAASAYEQMRYIL